MLDADHYGLEKVKERIVEYLAVQQRVDKLKAPILCLVGAARRRQDLARPVDRARRPTASSCACSLGGVRDEAEIRGHRRTYIGSMPGKILQNMTKVAVRNPLFLLDEVDKMGMDFRGDPSSALLEVLDPGAEQHVRRSLRRGRVRPVGRDVRRDGEHAEHSGAAARPHGSDPAVGLHRGREDRASPSSTCCRSRSRTTASRPSELHVAESALRDIVRYYTREAGVRSLERDISKICRKVVKALLLKQSEGKARKARGPVDVNSKNLDKYLGVRRYTYGIAEKQEPGRPGHRPRLDRSRRRAADDRRRSRCPARARRRPPASSAT